VLSWIVNLTAVWSDDTPPMMIPQSLSRLKMEV